jgi:hypothetical protein
MKAKEILTPKLCKPVISLRPWQGLEGVLYVDICERRLFVSKIASKMESPAVNTIESSPASIPSSLQTTPTPRPSRRADSRKIDGETWSRAHHVPNIDVSTTKSISTIWILTPITGLWSGNFCGFLMVEGTISAWWMQS